MDNPFEAGYLSYKTKQLLIEVMGSVPIHNLDKLKVTIRISKPTEPNKYRALRDQLDLYQDAQVQRLTRRISEHFDLAMQTAEDNIYDLIEELEKYRLEQLKAEYASNQPKDYVQTPEEQKQGIAFGKEKHLMQSIQTKLQNTGIVGEEKNAATLLMAMLSRKLQNPLGAICFAKSGTGKSHLMERVGKCIAPESVMESTQLTENSFYYFKKDELKHKVFLIEDLDGASDILYPLREMQTKKRLSKHLPVKDKNGFRRTKSITVEGPVCIIGCTTKEKVYEDNANRNLLLYLDDSKIQDEKVVDYIHRKSEGLVDEYEERQNRELLQQFDRTLEKIKIINPFARLMKLPRQTKNQRRTAELLTHLAEVITYVHQHQREKQVNEETAEEYIETMVEDVEWAFELMEPILYRKSDDLGAGSRKLYNWLQKENHETFYAKDIRKEYGSPLRTIQKYLKELTDYGYLDIVGGNAHRKGWQYKIEAESPALNQSIKEQLEATLNKIREYARSTHKGNGHTKK